MYFSMRVLLLLSLLSISFGDHFKGGSISWKPTNPSVITGNISIIITERYSWTFSRYPCNETIINSLGPYNDTQNATTGSIVCISSSAVCTSSLFTTISSPLYCTDFSTTIPISSGTYYTTQSLAVNSVIDIASRGASWMAETLANSWSLVSHIDLKPISNKINTSPVTASLPIVKLYVNKASTIQILAADWDNDQIVRCRWSYQHEIDECGDACFNLPNSQLNTVDCIITWTSVFRPQDIANGLTESTYIISITAEDFVNASSTTPLSSVPHQMLVYVYNKPANVCSRIPSISGFPLRDQACYGVTVNVAYTFSFKGTVFCENDTIVDFISTSPYNMQRSNIYRSSNYSWSISVSWTPTMDQIGLQPLCMAAVDNNGQTSNSHCIMIAVGGTNPTLKHPDFVQSTQSPVGTVMSTQKRFSIQTTTTKFPLRRTIRSGTYISIYLLNSNALAYRIDCRYSPDVYFVNNTIVFFIYNSSWILGATYYITMSDGVATSDEDCGIEAAGFTDSRFWRFTIWAPSVSSTTTVSTTTSTATTHTVTTRAMGTTTYNTLYTTTGLPAITTITTTSTTTSTSTSATTTTTTTATTTTTTTTTTTEYIPDADVMYPKDMERACLQPVTIATVIITVVMIPLRLLGLINLFVKMNSNNEKEILKARKLRRLRLEGINASLEEEETLV